MLGGLPNQLGGGSDTAKAESGIFRKMDGDILEETWGVEEEDDKCIMLKKTI